MGTEVRHACIRAVAVGEQSGDVATTGLPRRAVTDESLRWRVEILTGRGEYAPALIARAGAMSETVVEVLVAWQGSVIFQSGGICCPTACGRIAHAPLRLHAEHEQRQWPARHP